MNRLKNAPDWQLTAIGNAYRVAGNAAGVAAVEAELARRAGATQADEDRRLRSIVNPAGCAVYLALDELRRMVALGLLPEAVLQRELERRFVAVTG